jgi:CRISPR system Cascade subunit CasE
MYFSRVSLNPIVNLASFADNFCHDSYKEHQAVWKFFDDDPDSNRDFLYHYENRTGRPGYYIVSDRKPVDRKKLWKIETKLYQPKIYSGQVLAFMLRANPVITVNSKRHDVVMHEKQKINYNQLPARERPSLQHIVEKSGSAWLESRADQSGFSVSESMLKIDGYQTYRTYKKGCKKPISYSVIEYEGILKVTNDERFKQTLFNGLGRSKAFGCGLLMIRRVDSQ